MSKSNDISNMATLDDHRPLADSELDAVSGGNLSEAPNVTVNGGPMAFVAPLGSYSDLSDRLLAWFRW